MSSLAYGAALTPAALCSRKDSVRHPPIGGGGGHVQTKCAVADAVPFRFLPDRKHALRHRYGLGVLPGLEQPRRFSLRAAASSCCAGEWTPAQRFTSASTVKIMTSRHKD